MEPLKIVKTSSLCSLGNFLSPTSLIEFLLKIEGFSSLSDSSSSGSFEEVKLEVCERQSSEGIHSSRESGSWSVNQNSILVKNVNNDSKFAGVISVVNKSNSSWFNKSSETLE